MPKMYRKAEARRHIVDSGIPQPRPRRRRSCPDHRRRRLWVPEGLEDRRLLSGPTVYTINLTTDNGPTSAGSGSGTTGDLRYVINQANADPNPAGSLIEFDPTVFAAAQTITLSSSLGTLDLTESAGPEMIQGPGASLAAISGGNAIGVLQIGGGVTATVSNVTIENGSAPGPSYTGGGILSSGALAISDCTLSGNSAASAGDGGAIFNSGALTVTGCTFSANSAGLGGGAIFGSGPTTISNSAFSGNSAQLGGGFLNFGTGSLVQDSTFSGNSASDEGGGIDNAYGTIQAIVGCTLSGNSQGSGNISNRGGGGIANSSSGTIALISGCTLTGNTALGPGAGICNTSRSQGSSAYDNAKITLINDCTFSGDGIFNSATITAVNGCTLSRNSEAAIFNTGGSMALTACTLSENAGSQPGGGILNDNSGTMTLTACTLSENRVSGLSSWGGGGILNDHGSSMTATGCTLSGNSVNLYRQGAGGGILNDHSASMTLSGCTLSGNSADLGGGIANENAAALVVTGCTISGNNVPSGGDDGGGIFNDTGGTTTVIACTLFGNSAGSGGGIFNGSGSMTVSGSTLLRNSAFFGGGGICNGSVGTLTVGSAGASSIYGVQSCDINSAVYGNQATNFSDGGDLWNLGTLNISHSPVLTVHNQNPGATTVIVAASDTATVLTSSVNASGQVVYSAQVAAAQAGAGTPTGTVTLYDGNNTVLATSPLDASGRATFNTPGIAGSPTPLHAVYAGDGSFSGSTSEFGTGVATLSLSLTTTSLMASVASPVYGQPETFTATVAPIFAGAGTPSGTVTFSDYSGGSVLAAVPLTSSGGALTAALTTASLGAGGRLIVAAYNGDANFYGSASSAHPVVQPGAVKLTLGSTPATSYLADPLTFAVSAQDLDTYAGDPQATVSFIDGTQGNGSPNVIGSAPLVMTGSTGTATFTTTSLAIGAHTITVAFSTVSGSFIGNVIGPQDFSVTIVSPPPTTTTIIVPSSPPIAGLPFTLEATVATPAGTEVPTGTVTFYDGAATLGIVGPSSSAATASGDFATYSLTSPAPAAGSHLVRAVYNGIPGYSVSSSLDGGRISTVPTGDFAGLLANGTFNSGSFNSGYPFNVVEDHSGNLFETGSDASGNPAILEVQPNGATSVVIGTSFSQAAGEYIFPGFFVLNGAGDLFVAMRAEFWDPTTLVSLYEVTPGQDGLLSDGTITTVAGLYGPQCLTTDGAGNAYVIANDPSFIATGDFIHYLLYRVDANGTVTSSPFPSLQEGFPSILGFRVDGAGNIFLSKSSGTFEAQTYGTSSAIFGPFASTTQTIGPIGMDPSGNLYIGAPSGMLRVDMTPNLPISPLQSADVQTLLNNQGGSVTLYPISSAVVSNMVQAINGLSSPNSGTETVTLDLGGRTFTTDTQIQAPAGVTVVIQNGTLVGGSPALVVNSGNVVLKQVTARNATNAPTIVVNGGSLKVRNSTIQESTAYAQSALQVNGGTVDLGTAADPGGNVLNVNGPGALIQNCSGRSISVVGDSFENNGVANAASIYVLSPGASAALTVSNNTTLNIPGVVFVDSTSSSAVSIGSKAQVTAWASGVSVADPLAGLTGPSVTDPAGHPLPNYGSFVIGGNSKGSYTINPGIFSQITVSGSISLTMNPGIYIIEGGGLTVTGNASITGTGVFIYNASSSYPSSGGKFGGITLSGNGTFNLTAPSTGTYAGLLIFQSRQDTRALSFSANAKAGMTGSIYAANALLSMSGNASLTSPLVVGTLNLSGNVALTQISAGSDGSGDTSGIANTLLAGNLSVYINDPSSLFTADELARIQDAVNTWDGLLAPYNVTISLVTDPTQANIVIDTSTTSACGDMTNGVLGCFNSPAAEITMIQGWKWYAGADPSRIGTGQYDFETTVLHELGHALGLGGGSDPSSPMFETLTAGTTARVVTIADLNISDPPAGADPQTAAGFNAVPAAMSFSRNDNSPALVAASRFITIGLSSLTSAQAAASPHSAVGSGQSTVVGGWVSPRAEVESPLVIQGVDGGIERASRPWIRLEVVDLCSLLDGTQRSTEPAVDLSADSERPARARVVDRAEQPFDSSDIVPFHRAVDSSLEALVSESSARDEARALITGDAQLGEWTDQWNAVAEPQPVHHHTGSQPATEIPTDTPTVPPPGSRRGALTSPAQPADLWLKAGMFGIGATALTASALRARQVDGKRRQFQLRREFSPKSLTRL
jgi:hypothetical protein